MKTLECSDRNVKVVDLEDGRIAFAALTMQGMAELTWNMAGGTYKDADDLQVGKLQDGSVFFIIFKGEIK